MSLGETARLLASFEAKDGLTPAIGQMNKSLDKLDAHIGKSGTRAFKAGQQIGTGIKAGVVIATGAIAGIGALLLASAHEGQQAAKVQAVYATAIANSGKVSADYVTRLNAQQDALLKLTGTDDEVIKAQQTRLIQMGLTGAQVEKLTPLIFDLAASGKDLESSTTAVGKAAQGSNTALQRMGIIVPKGANAIDVLNQRFKGTAAALSGGLDVRLKVLNERLANLREGAGQKLLPALTKIVDVVADKLVPAFGEFIDAILPTAITGLDKLAGFLEGGGATTAITKFLTIARSVAPVLQSAAETTLTVIQTAVGLFSSLPPEIQALAVAGLTINKLTGGLVTNIAGGLISAVISSFKGLMNVNAAVVNVNGGIGGGLPGAALGAGEAAAGGIGVATLPALGLIAASVGATVIGSASVRSAVDRAIANADVASLTAQAEAARKHGVSDSNNAALKALQAIVHNTASLAAPTTGSQAGQDAAEKAQQARNSAFTSNPTRQELRVKVRDLEKLKPTKDTQRAIQSLQNRLQNRIDAEKAKIAAVTEAGTRAIVAAVKAAGGPPTIQVTVPVTTNFNSRLVEANLNRYTYLPGQGITKTSGFLP